MTALSVADWCHLSFCSSRLPWGFIEEKCSDQRSQKSFSFDKIKNSLGTNLSQFSILILNKPQMPNTKATFLPIDKFYTIAKIQSDPALSKYMALRLSWRGMFLFIAFSTHIFQASFFSQFKIMLYDFLAISIWNVFVKWWSSRGSPLKKSIGGLTLFRSHLPKLSSIVGSIFQTFVFLRYNFLSLRPF